MENKKEKKRCFTSIVVASSVYKRVNTRRKILFSPSYKRSLKSILN